MTAPLRAVVLCGPSPRHIYFANRLCETADVGAIVQQAGRDLSPANLLRLARPRNLIAKGSRWLRDRKRYAGGGEARFFFGDCTPTFTCAERVTRVSRIEEPAVVQIVDGVQPDLVAVFGTSVIRPPLLGAGRLGMVNLHGGLSPWYRGADNTFWALYNGEPDKVGCTLHYIDSGIDSGDLIAHVCPEVRPEDDELTLFWRAVRDATDVFTQLVQRLAQGERFGRPQHSAGSLYRVRDRKARHDRELTRRHAVKSRGAYTLEPRVTWYSGTPHTGVRRDAAAPGFPRSKDDMADKRAS